MRIPSTVAQAAAPRIHVPRRIAVPSSSAAPSRVGDASELVAGRVSGWKSSSNASKRDFYVHIASDLVSFGGSNVGSGRLRPVARSDLDPVLPGRAPGVASKDPREMGAVHEASQLGHPVELVILVHE